MEDRKRQANLDNLTREQVDVLSEQIGGKLRQIIDKACDEANKICNIYGMQVKMQFQMEQIKQEETKE